MQSKKQQFKIKKYFKLFCTFRFTLCAPIAVRRQSGIAALPTIIIISTLVLLIAVALVSSGLIENAISFGHKESQEAYVASELGVQDAIIRISRNKDFASAGYAIAVGNGTANIVVSGTSTKTVTSTGVVNNKTRKLQVVVNIGVCNGGSNDGNTCTVHGDCPAGGCGLGKVKQASWTEIE